MGNMKLSQFSGIKAQPELTQEPVAEPPVAESLPEVAPTVLPSPEPKVQEKPVTINIKITRDQHDWLSDTARTVRDNNLEPVPAGDRVYPQHLIGVAIDLLRNTKIDWSQVKNTEELKRLLNL
jgi:hypothetical protein